MFDEQHIPRRVEHHANHTRREFRSAQPPKPGHQLYEKGDTLEKVRNTPPHSNTSLAAV
jgi:hypothetical protein